MSQGDKKKKKKKKKKTKNNNGRERLVDAVGTVGGARGLERIARETHRGGRVDLDGAIPESDARRERRTDSVRARAGIFEETREADAPESVSGGGVRRENAGDETQNGEGKKEEAFGSEIDAAKSSGNDFDERDRERDFGGAVGETRGERYG